MPSNNYSNPYRDTSWAQAGSDLGTAIFGDPQIIAQRAQIDAQRAAAAQQQQNWERTFRMQSGEHDMKKELHPFNKREAEANALAAEFTADNPYDWELREMKDPKTGETVFVSYNSKTNQWKLPEYSADTTQPNLSQPTSDQDLINQAAAITNGVPLPQEDAIPSPAMPMSGQSPMPGQRFSIGGRPQVPSNEYVPYSSDPAQERSAYNAWLKENPGQQATNLISSLNLMEQFTDQKGIDPYQGTFGEALSYIPTWVPFVGGKTPEAEQFRQQSAIAAAASRTEPGQVSNYEQQLFARRVPNLSNTREANAAIIQVGKLGAQKKAETEAWMQRFIDMGGSFAQAQRIVNQYNTDPQSYAAQELTDGGIGFNPNYKTIDQWHQEKLGNPNSSLGDAVAPSATSTQITPDIARQFLQQAGGDREKARAMARQSGYSF